MVLNRTGNQTVARFILSRGAFTVLSYADKLIWRFPSYRLVWAVVRIKPYIKVKHSVFITNTVFKHAKVILIKFLSRLAVKVKLNLFNVVILDKTVISCLKLCYHCINLSLRVSALINHTLSLAHSILVYFPAVRIIVYLIELLVVIWFNKIFKWCVVSYNINIALCFISAVIRLAGNYAIAALFKGYNALLVNRCDIFIAWIPINVCAACADTRCTLRCNSSSKRFSFANLTALNSVCIKWHACYRNFCKCDKRICACGCTHIVGNGTCNHCRTSIVRLWPCNTVFINCDIWIWWCPINAVIHCVSRL